MLGDIGVGRPLQLVGVGLVLVGAAAALAGTVGAGPAPLAPLTAGLALVGVGLAVIAVGHARVDGPHTAHALVVLGFVGYHVLALVVALALAAGVLLGVASVATAALWGLGALGAVLVAWVWERYSGVDVDAAVENLRSGR